MAHVLEVSLQWVHSFPPPLPLHAKDDLDTVLKEPTHDALMALRRVRRDSALMKHTVAVRSCTVVVLVAW